MTTMTREEASVRAYMDGDKTRAAELAAIGELEDEIERLNDVIYQHESHIYELEKQINHLKSCLNSPSPN